MRSEGSTIKHKDVAKGPFKEVTGWYTVKEVDGEKIRTWNHLSDGYLEADKPVGTDEQNKKWNKQTWGKIYGNIIHSVVVEIQ